MRRTILTLVVILWIAAAGGALYQTIASALELGGHPPPGELVDVGGFRLHIQCTGEGSPTVILAHVGGGNSAEWALI